MPRGKILLGLSLVLSGCVPCCNCMHKQFFWSGAAYLLFRSKFICITKTKTCVFTMCKLHSQSGWWRRQEMTTIQMCFCSLCPAGRWDNVPSEPKTFTVTFQWPSCHQMMIEMKRRMKWMSGARWFAPTCVTPGEYYKGHSISISISIQMVTT